MEALLLAGGKAERLGEAAQGLPKPLVPVGGLPLAAYAVARLVESGVTRVIVACRAGDEEAFLQALAGLGADVEAVRDADAAVIVTEWPELREVATAEVREAMARPLIVDGRNLLDPAAAAAAGFEYEAIGRPTRATPGGVNGSPQPSRDRESTA